MLLFLGTAAFVQVEYTERQVWKPLPFIASAIPAAWMNARDRNRRTRPASLFPWRRSMSRPRSSWSTWYRVSSRWISYNNLCINGENFWGRRRRCDFVRELLSCLHVFFLCFVSIFKHVEQLLASSGSMSIYECSVRGEIWSIRKKEEAEKEGGRERACWLYLHWKHTGGFCRRERLRRPCEAFDSCHLLFFLLLLLLCYNRFGFRWLALSQLSVAYFWDSIPETKV